MNPQPDLSQTTGEEIVLRSSLNDIKPSLTLVLKAKVDELRKKGVHVISFTVGEPDFPTPLHIKQAGIKAIEENFTRYTSGLGIPELREAIAAKLRKENGLNYQAENIIVSSGGKQAISSAIIALTQPGDEVLIPNPYWLSYPAMVILANANFRYINTKAEDDYRITPELLESHIGPKSRVLILNSPSNPTGSMYHAQHFAALVPIIKKYKLAVISDEIYEKLLYDGRKFVSLAEFTEIKKQIVLINGVSKSFAMTGWRIGYAAAEPHVIKGMNKVQSHLTGNACSISQKAACQALQTNMADTSELCKMQVAFEQRRNLAYELISKVPGLPCNKPEGAFYLFPRCDSFFGKKSPSGYEIKGSETLANYLLDECRVSVVPGVDFGMDTNFRISFACSENDIKEGIKRIKEGLAHLK